MNGNICLSAENVRHICREIDDIIDDPDMSDETKLRAIHNILWLIYFDMDDYNIRGEDV